MASHPRTDGFQVLVHTVTGSKGELKTATRRALYVGAEPPASLKTFVETVTENAYKVTDALIEELKAAGYSDDQIFEATVVVAVRSAAVRLEATERAIEAAG